MDGMTFIQGMNTLLFADGRPDGKAPDFKGEVIRVLDGDTIEVLHEKKSERIRWYGIDCPEEEQAFGQKAKQATSSLLFGKEVRIESHGRDKHRRTLGTVFDGNLNVNQELVKEGWCWWFRKFVPKDQVLKQFEQEAKEAKKGLWQILIPCLHGCIVDSRREPIHSVDTGTLLHI
jgi:endonuclease YncB( thermonuclease family)